MFYLYIDTKIVCTWCKEPMLHVIEDDLNKIIIKLCPVCDKYPIEFWKREE